MPLEESRLQQLALGIQQPWAELILRGEKTLEVRSRHTQVRGRIFVYASRRASPHLAAQRVQQAQQLDPQTLPCGLLVGEIELVSSRLAQPSDADNSLLTPDELQGKYVWELRHPQRLAEPTPVRFIPYGIWFYPFQRRTPMVTQLNSPRPGDSA